MKTLAITAAIAGTIAATACTPHQIEVYKTLAPHEQAAVRQHWHDTHRRPTDCYQAVRQVFPSHLWGWADSIVHRESRNNPAAQNSRSSAAGCFQTLRLHAGRYDRLGFSWSDRYDALANTTVAYDLYLDAGTSPWRI